MTPHCAFGMMDITDSKTAAFVDWFKSRGGTLRPSITLTSVHDHGVGRGVFATEDIAEDEVLFTIPRSAVLTVENSDLRSKMLAADPQNPKLKSLVDSPWLELIMVMIYEYLRGGSSPWKSYFDILPSEFNSLMFWSQDELDELKGSAVLEKIGKENTDKGFREFLVPVIQEFSSLFTLSADMVDVPISREPALLEDEIIYLAHRMGSTIMAYAFDLENTVESEQDPDDEGFVSDDEDVIMPKGMVPLADMLNADADKNNARLFQTLSELEMRSTKPIRKGEELFNDYGPLPRSDLLRRYGYITKNYAQYDVVEIAFQSIVDVAGEHLEPEELEGRIAYLEEEGVYDSAYDLSHPTDTSSAFPDELIILITVLLLPRGCPIPKKLPRPKITPRVAEVLQQILATRIGEYPTKLQYDEMLLRRGDLSPRMRMAVEVRLGEKIVLREAWTEIGGDEAEMEDYDQPMEVDLQVGMKRGAEDSEDETDGVKVDSPRGKRRKGNEV